MIQQLSKSLVFEAFFTASKVGKTGLTVTVDIYNNAGTLVVTAGSATAIGGGYYSYTLSSGSVVAAGNYRAIFKTTDTTVDQQHIPSLWTAGEDWVQNLDVATSTRNATTPLSASQTANAVWDETASSHTTAGSMGAKEANLDAAVSSRNATAPDNTSIATILTRTDVNTSTRASATDYTTARAAKLDNLDATVSSRSSHTAADVWSSGTRTLTSFGTLVADIATAVWGAATRTLTALGIPVTVGTNNDKTGYSLATPPPTAAAISTQVWSETLPGSYTSTQAGYKLNAAGSAADPLLNAVPGSYASGSAGYALGRLVSASVSISAPVISSGNVEIIRGDSYYSADARALVWTITGLPTINLTGAVTTFAAKRVSSILTKTNSSTPGVTASFLSGTLTLTVELDSDDTTPLSYGPYNFDIQTQFSNGHVETWVQGTMTVVADVR